jgi:hypothetical protein
MTTTDAPPTLTDFLQHSGRVLTGVEEGEVILRRREGDDLVLLSHRHWKALTDSLRALAEAYDGMAGRGQPANRRRTWFALPWMSLLTEEDQAACVAELSHTAIAAIESGKLDDLSTVLAQWKATALATWDDERRRDRQGQTVDDPRPLPRP